MMEKEEFNSGNPLALPIGHELEKRYRVGKVLGAGGFGITYKAYDTINNSFCAIKEYVPLDLCIRGEDRIWLNPANSEKAPVYEHGKERFMQEAAVLLEVADIPNIVRLTDYFEQNGTAYYVMEYLDGCTLRQLQKVMPDKRLPFSELCEIFRIVGMALERVHERKNLLHRDISPDNIFYTKDQRVKLIDFGSAKHVSGQENQAFSVLLKPGYAPPEQYRSNTRQGRYTDVYALASTFYYLCCGVMLPDAMERCAGTTYTPAWKLAPEMSRQMSAVLDKALQLDYHTRYQTVAEFMDEFAEAGRNAHEGYRENGAAVITASPGMTLPGKKTGGKAMLTWREKNGQLTKCTFPFDVMVKLGRSESYSQLVIRGYPEISKLHCYIQYDTQSGKYLVKDVSTNGTFLGGQPLAKNLVYAVPEDSVLKLAGVCQVELGVKYGE